MKARTNDRGKKKIKEKIHIIIYNARERRKKGKGIRKNGNEERMRG